MVRSSEVDEDWGKLADTGDAEREAAMLARYNELAAMEEAPRDARLQAMANAEYALPDAQLRVLTLSRLRALLKMDPNQARTLVTAYDGVMRGMSANAAMRRVGMVQTLAADFTAEEEEQLRELVPAIFAAAPKRGALDVEIKTFERAPEPKKKAWWAFWSK